MQAFSLTFGNLQFGVNYFRIIIFYLSETVILPSAYSLRLRFSSFHFTAESHDETITYSVVKLDFWQR